MTPAEAIERSKEAIASHGWEEGVRLARQTVEYRGLEWWFAEGVEKAVQRYGEPARAACNSREFRQYVAGLLGMC